MFREMRRKKQILSNKETISVLEKCTSGVLAVLGDDGYPYTVPLSYVYEGKTNKIYFHSAKTGHKIDAIRKLDKVSFCVIEQDQIVPERFTTYYRSVIVFGRIQVIESGEKWQDAIHKLISRYSPNESSENIQKEIKTASQFCILEMSIEHMTGKEAIELVREKQEKS